MGGLQRFENRLEQMISGVFARTFRSAVQPVEIAAALEREVDNNAQILSRNRRLVPNAFHIELSGTDHERLEGSISVVARELGEQLQEHAAEQSYVFPGPVKIYFESVEDLTTGRFRIRSNAEATVSGAEDADWSAERRPVRAVLEVNGTRHPLRPPGLVVGRGSEADLRINDPGISRKHAQFLVSARSGGGVPGAGELTIEVHDMGSTNGIQVDGRKVPRATLADGSRVQVGHTAMTVRLDEGGDDV